MNQDDDFTRVDQVTEFRECVMDLLDYNAFTGKFVWKTSRGGVVCGKEAGCINKSTGYREIGINEKLYKSHRIAWLICKNEIPIFQIDRINGIKTDNRISNLREATHSENQRNKGMRKDNSSKFIGVSYNIKSNKYESFIRIDKHKYHLGYFNDAEEAAKVRDLEAIRLHLDYARLNFDYTLTEDKIIRYTDY